MKRLFIFGAICVAGFLLMLGGSIQPTPRQEPPHLPKPEQLGTVLPGRPVVAFHRALPQKRREPLLAARKSPEKSPFTPPKEVQKRIQKDGTLVY